VWKFDPRAHILQSVKQVKEAEAEAVVVIMKGLEVGLMVLDQEKSLEVDMEADCLVINGNGT
jgi:hypothetical protein